jgi:hypothetical protein
MKPNSPPFTMCWLRWIAVALLLSGCGWTRPARDALLTFATDYRVCASNPHGMTIDYNPAHIDEATLAPIAEKEASRYGKTARPGALMVSHSPRVNQQFFEFVDR